ncbi:MAG: polyprenyl synthetase family protein [Planctomycetes bacterium]|nr:polyprenyl synthetase family protein [Planctomycetota bacterium]
MLLVAPGNGEIGERLAEELADIEGRFAAELMSDLPCVNELVGHVERYRGKMLRPMLVLVSGLAASPTGRELTDGHRVVATVAEMVHMATLVHDDVLDDALVRRRGETVNNLRGNETAVMLGDYLISHAYHLCSSLPSPVPARIIADATNTVCEGELLQLANRENWALDEPTYFEIIRRKTASLCGTCCRLGAIMSDNGSPHADALYSYGEKVGTAFQIVDDMLDLTGTLDTVGKTLGRDLDKGKLTLPLIHHLRTVQPARRARSLAMLGDADTTGGGGSSPREVVELLNSTGSIAYADQAAHTLITDARRLVQALAPSSARELLLEMADAVVTRKF